MTFYSEMSLDPTKITEVWIWFFKNKFDQSDQSEQVLQVLFVYFFRHKQSEIGLEKDSTPTQISFQW